MVPKAKDHVASPAHGGGAERSFTPQEVEKHNKSDDVWLIVRDAVYDVSKFVDRHPGGDLILLQKGRDVTSMFESLHPSTAQKTLDKFKIGTVAAGSVRSTITFPPAEQRNFYPTLKARVEEYFKTSGEKRRDNPRMYLKALSIIAFTLTAWYFTFISASPSLPLRFLFAAAWGCGMALVGVAIQHDANHGAMSNNKHVCTVFGATLDYLSGASSYMWRQQHDYGHHSYTNIHDKDPDIRVTETDIRRVTKWQPLHKWHYGQHIYLPILYSLLGLKSVFIDDYAALYKRRIGNVTFDELSFKNSFIFWTGKLFYFSVFLTLPAFVGSVSIGQHAALYITAMLITGWYLAFMFQVAHVVPDLDWYKPGANNQVTVDWAELQVKTTANFCSRSPFWNFISGGLSNQIEHHLFPSTCHVHYPAISPIVKKTCEEFGIKYYDFPTFWSALAAHFNYLKDVGIQHPLVPSLGD